MTVPLLADNCVKCGRPLTNPNSRRARVGTTCIQRYGSQQKDVLNPEYEAWNRKRSAADAERAAKQAIFNHEHSVAVAEYRAAKSAYKAMKKAG